MLRAWHFDFIGEHQELSNEQDCMSLQRPVRDKDGDSLYQATAFESPVITK